MGQAFPHLLGLFLLMMLPLYGQLQVLTVEPDWSTFFTGESVKLICDMRGQDADWYYAMMKDDLELYPFSSHKTHMVQLMTTDQGGKYSCIGFNKERQTRKPSTVVSLTVSDRNLILQHPAAILYRGETAPLRCRHRLQTDMTTATFYNNGSLIVTDPNQRTLMMSENAAEVGIQLQPDSSYSCKLGTGDESQSIRVKVDPYRPKAELRKDEAVAGGKVTLTCSTTIPSHGWKFFWYRGKKKESLTAQDVAVLSKDRISTSQGGVYWCRGGRGNPVYYTEYSNPIVTSAAAVTLQPSWPEIYYGEALTLCCQIEGGEDFEWIYEWAVTKSQVTDYIQTKNEYRINYATGLHNGSYFCSGQMKNKTLSTAWSPAFNLRVSNKKLLPNLTVSPSWLSPGDSVTLNCNVKYPDAGWRFYWYKAIPNLFTKFYTMELLPGSSNGTEQPYFIVYGQKQTAGYFCKAARGNPQLFTYSSQVKFVWSGDFQSAATLSVSPDRAQHFITDTLSLSLTCAGDSAEWIVKRFSSSGYLTRCATWGSMTGATCYIKGWQFIDGVYWCETAAGLFSNAVNITGSYDKAIMDFPVHPVPEGQPVSLRCNWTTKLNLVVISFYKNDKLIQNDTRGELFIPAVSKADEGFYKCGRKDRMQWSPASWMSIKTAVSSQQSSSSPFPVWLTVGLVCGTTLSVLFLLVLGRYAKQLWHIRSPDTNEHAVPDHKTNLNNTGPAPPKGSAKNTASATDDSAEVEYALIFLKKSAEGGRTPNSEESAVYSNVAIQSTTGKLQSAQDGAVYSEVKKKD